MNCLLLFILIHLSLKTLNRPPSNLKSPGRSQSPISQSWRQILPVDTTVSERPCFKDLKTEKKMKYVYPLQKTDDVLKFEFPSILLLKKIKRILGIGPICGINSLTPYILSCRYKMTEDTICVIRGYKGYILYIYYNLMS